MSVGMTSRGSQLRHSTQALCLLGFVYMPVRKTVHRMSLQSGVQFDNQLSTCRAKFDKSLLEHLLFLRSANPAHIVLGNESADFDSITSALVYSYLCGTSRPTLPVINARREDLILRRDVCNALSFVNIPESSLHLIDDPTTIHLLSKDEVSITLVDHNSLAPHQTSLSSRVESIIDHHQDEQLFPNANPRQIQPVGSCATLIANCFNLKKITPSAAFLLLSSILLDCQNLDKKAAKATALDEETASQLCEAAGVSNTSHRGLLYESLFQARRDLSGFSARDLLRKDTKFIASGEISIAISSVLVSAHQLIERTSNKGLVGDVEQLCADWGVHAIIVMAAFQGNDGVFHRELLVSRSEIGTAIFNTLLCESNALELKPNDDSITTSGFHYLEQLNTKASRKVVLPLVRKIIGDL